MVKQLQTHARSSRPDNHEVWLSEYCIMAHNTCPQSDWSGSKTFIISFLEGSSQMTPLFRLLESLDSTVTKYVLLVKERCIHLYYRLHTVNIINTRQAVR